MGRVYRFWEGSELRTLRKLKQEGLPYREVATRLDRSIPSVKCAILNYQLSSKRNRAKREERRRLVRECHAKGMTPNEITRKLKDYVKSNAQIYRDHKEMKLTPHRLLLRSS